jgi:hypothetical protein
VAVVSARERDDDDGIIIKSMDVFDSLVIGGSIATLVVSIDSMDVVDDDDDDDDDDDAVGGSIATLVVLVFIDSAIILFTGDVDDDGSI